MTREEFYDTLTSMNREDEIIAEQHRQQWAPAGGVKHDGGKPRMDLLDAYALTELAKVLTFGAQKYAPDNWRKGIAVSRLLAALHRHVFAFQGGQDTDEETGLPHLAHAMCCVMFLLWTMKNLPEQDDRYKEASHG